MKKIISLFFLALIASGCATPQVPFRNFQASVPTYNADKYPLSVMIRVTREDVDMQSSSDMLLNLPAPVAGGKVQTYIGRYFGKMLLQGANNTFKSASEYIGQLQYPGKMQALLGAVKDKSVDLIILGMPREVRIIELKNMDGDFGAAYGLGKNEPWNLNVGAKTEIVALNNSGQVIYKGEYLDTADAPWKQWRALGQADASELFCAVHGAYDNIFEKQVSKFLFELSESNDFKKILGGNSGKIEAGVKKEGMPIQPPKSTSQGEQTKAEPKKELTFPVTNSVDIYLDSDPSGAEIYWGYGIPPSWSRISTPSSDVTPMTCQIDKYPSSDVLGWGGVKYQARKTGYHNSEVVTLKQMHKKRKHTFILKKKEN